MRDYERIIRSLQEANRRLEGVYIFNEDFEAVIDRFDRTETFFYCDPPYYGSERCYVTDFSGNHERLAARLKTIKGKFLLSYNENECIRDQYDWATIEAVETFYSYGNNRTRCDRLRANEILISNYRRLAG